MSLGTYFSSIDLSLSNLSDSILEDIHQVVLSHRDGVDSICVFTPNLGTLESLLPNGVPSEVYKATTARYAVDLLSIGTDQLRLYVDSPASDETLIGYYFTSDNRMSQKKNYKRNPSNIKSLLIDRYDNVGTLISSNEPENESDSSCWQGNPAWAAMAEASPYRVRYLFKGSKPQSYIFVQS